MQLTLFFFISFILSHHALSSSLSSSHQFSHHSHLSHLSAHTVVVCQALISLISQALISLISQPTPPNPPHSADPRLRPVLRSDPRHLSILFAVIEFVCLFFFFLNVFSYGFGGCGGGG